MVGFISEYLKCEILLFIELVLLWVLVGVKIFSWKFNLFKELINLIGKVYSLYDDVYYCVFMEM